MSALTDACRTDCVRYTEQVPFFDMELFYYYSNPHKMAIEMKAEKRPRFATHVPCEHLIICESSVPSSPGYCVVFTVISRDNLP